MRRSLYFVAPAFLYLLFVIGSGATRRIEEIKTAPIPAVTPLSWELNLPPNVVLARFQGPPPTGNLFFCAAGIVSVADLQKIVSMNELTTFEPYGGSLEDRGRCSHGFTDLCDPGSRQRSSAGACT